MHNPVTSINDNIERKTRQNPVLWITDERREIELRRAYADIHEKEYYRLYYSESKQVT